MRHVLNADIDSVHKITYNDKGSPKEMYVKVVEINKEDNCVVAHKVDENGVKLIDKSIFFKEIDGEVCMSYWKVTELVEDDSGNLVEVEIEDI